MRDGKNLPLHFTWQFSGQTVKGNSLSVIIYFYMCAILHQATSQVCLYNYTISSEQTIVVTQNASVCLLCSETSRNQWTISSVRYTPTLASYILDVPSPQTTLNSVLVKCTSTIKSTAFIVIPVYPPVVTYVNEATTLSLICSSVISASGLVVIEQIWLDPNGKKVSEFSNYDMQFVNRSSAGVYTCVTKFMSNSGAEATVNASTQVVVNYLPKIVPLQADTYVIQGLSVQLKCAFEGLPVPAITWSFSEGNILPSMSTIGVNLNVTVLTLMDLTGGNTGIYTCSASNVVGNSAASTQLFVQVPPSPPYGLNAFAVDNSSISLEGTNEFNGYSSLVFVVISYSVDRYPEDGISVLTLSLNSSNSICRLHCLPTLSGLHPYSNYSINVSLTNAVGLTSDSSNIIVTTLSLRPTSPLITRIVSITVNQLRVTWMPPFINSSTTAPVVSWTVIYSCASIINPNCSSGVIPSIPFFNTSHLLSGLVNDTNYTIAVTGINSGGVGDFSIPAVGLTTVDIPPPPENFTLMYSLQAGSTYLSASWSETIPRNGIITGYSVYCNTSTNQSYPELVIGQNTPTIRSVVNAETLNVSFNFNLTWFTQYSCFVTANTSAGEGSPSRIATAMTGEGVPSFSRLVFISSILGFPTYLMVNWSVPMPRNGIITYYTVYCNISDSQAYPEQVIGPNVPTIRSVVNGTTLATTLTGLIPFTQYSCYVTANTSVGEGSFSNISTALTTESVPSSPQNFSITPVAGFPTQLSASWFVPRPRNGIITGYSVYCNTSANQTNPEQVIGRNVPTIRSVVNGLTLATTLTGLNPFTQYSCYVTANTSVGEGSLSNISTVLTTESVPSSPQNFSITPVAGFPTQLSASWSAPIPRNGIITGYSVYCNTSANQTYLEQVIGPNAPTIRSVLNGKTLATTLTGLYPFTQYSCYVTANTSVGEGSPSVVATAKTVDGILSSPTNVTLLSVGPNTLMAMWSKLLISNLAITGYTVYCNVSANQTYSEQIIGPNVPTVRSTVNGTTQAIMFNTRLDPFTQYECYVTANTSAGEGSPSVIVTAKTAEGVPSGAPSNVVAITITPTSVHVSWDDLPNTTRNGILIAYEVKFSWPLENGQFYANTSGATHQLVLNSLQECVQYSISVRAYTSQGPGPFSGQVLDSSLNMYAQVPQPPEVLPSALTATSANLTWSCPLEKNYTIISYSVNVTVTDPNSIDADCLQGQNFSYYIIVPGYQRYIQLVDMSLGPFTSYSFEVLVATTEGEGDLSKPRSFTTLQAPPTSPLNISASVLSYSSLLVSWSPPVCSNGIILGYMVTYTPSRGFPSSSYNTSNTTTLLLQNLLNNTEYSIYVCAFTAAGCSLNVATNATTFPGPTNSPFAIFYLRVSTATNVDNHQNDAAVSTFQDEVYYALNSSNDILETGKSNFVISCTSVPMCLSQQYRIECKISIYLNLNSYNIAPPLNIKNITMDSLIPLVDTQNISAKGFCSCDLRVNSGRGIYNWPEGVPGQNISLMCQYGIIGQYITRYCNENLTWSEDDSKCPTVVTDQFNQLKAEIKNQILTAINLVNVSTTLLIVVSRATEIVDQSAANLAVVTTVIAQISNVTRSSPDVPVSNNTVINIVSVLSSIQNWPPTVLRTNGSVLVQLFEEIATRFVQQDNFTTLDFTQDQARIFAERSPLLILMNTGKTFSTESNQAPANRSNVPTMSRLSKNTASVELPPSLFSSISPNLTNVGIFFIVYKTASLFPIANSSGGVEVSSLVVGVTVATGQQIRNLTDPIVLNFSIPTTTAQDNGNLKYTCVSWDFKASGGIGNWITDGCNTNQMSGSNTTTIQTQCRCFHLTNFAVLVDISERTSPHNTSNPFPPEIDIISKIGIALSLFGLVTTVITLLFIKKIRQKDVSKYHIQLCCALIGMLLVFVIGIDRTENFGGCVTASVLIHYFTLAAVMWMGAEALFMFQKLVLVFFQTTTRYTVVLSLICWVAPLVPVIIPLAIDRSLLVKRIDMNNSTSGFCFINNTGVFFGAFLGPILLVLSFNMIIFIVVIVILVRHQFRRAKEQNRKFGSLKLMINVASIAFLFGLTWIFGALTVMNANQAFQIMFTLTNSFQGFLIFIFFCVLNSEVRLVARKLLGKRAPQTSTTGLQKRYESDLTESIFIEDVPSLGSAAKLTRTITRLKRFMTEVVELKFDDDESRPAQSETSASSCIVQTEELASITTQYHIMEEAVEIRLYEKETSSADKGNDLCSSNKKVENEL